MEFTNLEQRQRFSRIERVTGIEPALSAWELLERMGMCLVFCEVRGPERPGVSLGCLPSWHVTGRKESPSFRRLQREPSWRRWWRWTISESRSFSGDGQRHHKSHDLLRWPLAIGTLINHEYRQGPPTISQVDDPHDVPDASCGRHRSPRFSSSSTRRPAGRPPWTGVAVRL